MCGNQPSLQTLRRMIQRGGDQDPTTPPSGRRRISGPLSAKGATACSSARSPGTWPRRGNRWTTSIPGPGPPKQSRKPKILGLDVRVIASSEDKNFSYIPKEYTVDSGGRFLILPRTIPSKAPSGPNFQRPKRAAGLRHVFGLHVAGPLTRPLSGSSYAGAQKNIGPAGTALVIIRKDMLNRVPEDSLHHAGIHASRQWQFPLFNTPSLLHRLIPIQTWC